MVDEPLMSIGTFSRATLLSIRALRAYHEQGILVPASVDPATGYRAYHPSQLPDGAVLRRLRELDLPLASVKEVLGARDPEVTRKILADHEAAMQSRLAETERIVADLQRAVDRPVEETPVHVQAIPHSHALALRGVVPYLEFSAFFERAYPILGEQMAGGGFVMSGPAGALYEPVVRSDDAEPVTAYVPIARPEPVPEPSQGVEVIELPAQEMAVIAHRGSYETIGDTYVALGSWVAYNAEPSGEQVREIYVVSVGDVEDPADYRTEIYWPIQLKEPNG